MALRLNRAIYRDLAQRADRPVTAPPPPVVSAAGISQEPLTPLQQFMAQRAAQATDAPPPAATNDNNGRDSGGTSRGSGGDLGRGNSAADQGQQGNAADPSSLGGRIGAALGTGPGPIGLAQGLIGTAAQQGLLGPNLQGNQNIDINANPAAFADFSAESPGWLGDQMAQNASAQLAHSIDEAAGNPSGMTGSAGSQSNEGSAQPGGGGAADNSGGSQGNNGGAQPGGGNTGAGNAGGAQSGGGAQPGGGGGDGTGGGGGGGDACFDEATPILMDDGTEKSIAEISEGDRVMAFDGMGMLRGRRVTALVSRGELRPTLEIDGVRVTATHRFLTPVGEWVRAHKLQVGDELVTASGRPHAIRSITDGGERRVYNFTVAELHTYVAGGFRVHNSKAKGGVIPGPRPTDPNKDNTVTTAQGGEVVMNEDAGDIFGRDHLTLLNELARQGAPTPVIRKAVRRMAAEI